MHFVSMMLMSSLRMLLNHRRTLNYDDDNVSFNLQYCEKQIEFSS